MSYGLEVRNDLGIVRATQIQVRVGSRLGIGELELAGRARGSSSRVELAGRARGSSSQVELGSSSSSSSKNRQACGPAEGPRLPPEIFVTTKNKNKTKIMPVHYKRS